MNSNEAIKDVEIMPFAAGAHSKGPNEIRGTSREVIKVSPLLIYIFMFGICSLFSRICFYKLPLLTSNFSTNACTMAANQSISETAMKQGIYNKQIKSLLNKAGYYNVTKLADTLQGIYLTHSESSLLCPFQI